MCRVCVVCRGCVNCAGGSIHVGVVSIVWMSVFVVCLSHVGG